MKATTRTATTVTAYGAALAEWAAGSVEREAVAEFGLIAYHLRMERIGARPIGVSECGDHCPACGGGGCYIYDEA